MLLVPSLPHPPTHKCMEQVPRKSLMGPKQKHFWVSGLALLCERFLPPQHGLRDQSPQTQMVSVNGNQRDVDERLGELGRE